MSTEVDDFLAHFGVKGMKWGVSRASGSVKSAIGKRREKKAAVRKEREQNRDAAANAGYSSKQRRADFENLGRGGMRRVEKRIASGESIRAARTKEYASSTAKGLAVGAAILGTPIAISATSRGLSNLASSINAKRGAEAAAKLLADSKGLTSYKTIALAFDEATGRYR